MCPQTNNIDMKAFRSSLVFCIVVAVGSLTFSPREAKADNMRDFVMSCTYGVLAGTLVGAASLSFTDKPGDKLYRIARGASIGLYAGILLGWYVTSLDDNPTPPPQDEEALFRYQPPKLQVYPLISDRGVEGGAFKYSVLSF